MPTVISDAAALLRLSGDLAAMLRGALGSPAKAFSLAASLNVKVRVLFLD